MYLDFTFVTVSGIYLHLTFVTACGIYIIDLMNIKVKITTPAFIS